MLEPAKPLLRKVWRKVWAWRKLFRVRLLRFRIYNGENFTPTHYDFYRLNDAGIMSLELASVLEEPENITVVEWAESVAEILPENRILMEILSKNETSRKVKIFAEADFWRNWRQKNDFIH